MAKRDKLEEINAKPPDVEVCFSCGETTGQAVRVIGVTEQKYHRWCLLRNTSMGQARQNEQWPKAALQADRQNLQDDNG